MKGSKVLGLAAIIALGAVAVAQEGSTHRASQQELVPRAEQACCAASTALTRQSCGHWRASTQRLAMNKRWRRRIRWAASM
jgi:hypothetical protein